MYTSHRVQQILCLAGAFVMVLTYNACGASMPFSVPGLQGTSEKEMSSLADLNDASAVQNKALQIISNNCTSCHAAASGPAGVFNLMDIQHMVQTELIVPGRPDNSKLMIVIEANRMPPGSPLSSSDKEILKTWIIGGANAPATPPIVNQPPSPQIPQVPVTGSLEEKAIAILQNSCFSCHGSVTSGGLTKINDPAHLIATGFVKLEDAAGSPIYDAISKGRMPKGGMLSSGDIQIISDWITAGAKTPAGGSVPPPPQLPPLGPNYKSLSANIFFPKCVGCHSGTGAREGVRLDTYTNVLKEVTKGNPAESKVYEMTSDGEMPPRPNPQLSSAELRAIADWITAGAPNN